MQGRARVMAWRAGMPPDPEPKGAADGFASAAPFSRRAGRGRDGPAAGPIRPFRRPVAGVGPVSEARRTGTGNPIPNGMADVIPVALI